MAMKKIIITSILFVFTATTFAQKNLFGIGWEINFPNNADYINKTSLSGGKIEYRHFFKKNFSAGLALNWATYEEYLPRQTFVKLMATVPLQAILLPRVINCLLLRQRIIILKKPKCLNRM
jgi:hypothetical protein